MTVELRFACVPQTAIGRWRELKVYLNRVSGASLSRDGGQPSFGKLTLGMAALRISS
jgi:hypothetical protein